MVRMLLFRPKELKRKRAARKSKRRLTLFLKRGPATSASATAFSPPATSPGSSSGPNTSPSRGRKEFSSAESKFPPPLPSSPAPSTRTRVTPISFS